MNFPLVYIVWIDASGSDERTGWTDLEDALSMPDRPHVCRTVGWLVLDGERVKRVVQNVQDVDVEVGAYPAYFNEVSITNEQIVLMRRLVPADEDS